MEGTALSLAKLTLDTVLPLAKHAVANEVTLLLGVHQEVSFISNELEMMQAFLRAAGVGDRARNEVVKIWVKQVRDLAYDVEDCLQEYLALDLGVPASTGWLRSCLVPASQVSAQHRIAVRIKEVKAKVEEVSKRNLRYSIVVQPAPADPADNKHLLISPTFAADATEEELLVGRAKQRAELLDRLTASPSDGRLQVLAVWGMGGMGKTVLVQDVLWSSELDRLFDCRSGVTVPHPFNMVEFLRSFISKLDIATLPAKRVNTAQAAQLRDEVAHHLEDKRYAVVVDDVSSVSAEWEHIKRVFPDRNTGSWIIVTTRHQEVAKHCSTALPSQSYPLSNLSPEDALQLLCKKAHIDGPLPKELMDEADPILKRCGGLPLAVAAVGGLIATKPNSGAEWKKLHNHIGSELKGNMGLEGIYNVLTSSYEALPYDLKSCFLYLAVFPKHHEIRQRRMVRRWMAEGLVTENRDMAPEEVGESCFNQLISRSMIQPATKWGNLDDQILTCQVHDLMHEIILAKSVEENQLFMLNDQPLLTLPLEKVRHLVIDCGCSEQQDILESINMSHIRSLTVFGEHLPHLINPSKLRMLRALDLEDCPSVTDIDLADVGELRNLKYLGLRKTSITKLPESVGKLKFLMTLDLRETKVAALPQGITKLEKLRHLLAGNEMWHDDTISMQSPSFHKMMSRLASSTTLLRHAGCQAGQCIDPCFGVRLPDGFGKLRRVRHLGRVDVGQGGQRALKDIGKLAAVLHCLELTGLTEKNGSEFCDTIEKLHNLEHLEVRSKSKHGLLRCLESVSSPPLHLGCLRLCGYLGQLPCWIGFLTGITFIELLTVELAQDAIEVLGGLPNLVGLRLWRKSYVGQKLHMSADKFKKLKFISLDALDDLVSLVIVETAMPQLESLWIYRCCMLNDGDDGVVGVQFLVRLKEIRLKYSGDKDRLEAVLQRLVRAHPNRPHLMFRRAKN